MPAPPKVDLLTRFVLENPWPLGVGLLVIATILAWRGFREGLPSSQRAGFAAAAAGAAVILTGWIVKTSGEHAQEAVAALVRATVAEDLIGIDRLLTDDAVLSVGSPTNPGFDKEVLMSSFGNFAAGFQIEDNAVTTLKGYGESANAAIVHLRCRTTVDRFPYPNASAWVIAVRREDDGRWMVSRLTCIDINGRTPSLDALRGR